MAFMLVTGRIGRDPERRYTQGQNQKSFFTFSVADSDSMKDETDWWDCIYFPHGEADEKNFGNLVKVGALIKVQGSAKKKKPYTGTDGVRRMDVSLEVKDWRVLVYPPKKDEAQQEQPAQSQPREQPKPAPKPQPEQTTISQAAPNDDPPFDPDDDTLPF